MVGVALVASAANSLTRITCKNKVTMAINAAAAVVVYYYSPTWIFPVLLMAGGLFTLAIHNHDGTTSTAEDAVQSIGVGRWLGSLLMSLWIVILATSIAIHQSTSYGSHKVFHWWETFYPIGSSIFGGQAGLSFLLPQLKSNTAHCCVSNLL